MCGVLITAYSLKHLLSLFHHFMCKHRAKELAFLQRTGLLVTLLKDGRQLWMPLRWSRYGTWLGSVQVCSMWLLGCIGLGGCQWCLCTAVLSQRRGRGWVDQSAYTDRWTLFVGAKFNWQHVCTLLHAATYYCYLGLVCTPTVPLANSCNRKRARSLAKYLGSTSSGR